MLLNVVSDYVREARVLLQDLVPPYRYDDDGLVAALNMALTDAMLLRPDFLSNQRYQGRTHRAAQVNVSAPVTLSATTDMGTAVPVPPGYAMAFLYYIVGEAQLRDTEDTQDSRAATYLAQFKQRLLSL